VEFPEKGWRAWFLEVEFTAPVGVFPYIFSTQVAARMGGRRVLFAALCLNLPAGAWHRWTLSQTISPSRTATGRAAVAL
jgi:hypothetical protein